MSKKWLSTIQTIILLALTMLAGELRAQDAAVRYQLTVRGLQAGEFIFIHSIEGTDYKVNLEFQTTGLAGALFDARISAKSAGMGIKNGAYEPSDASFLVTQGDQTIRQEMQFDSGVLTNLVTEPRQLTTLDPAKQAGAVDPLTAIAYLLRPVPVDNLCRLNVRVFDGVKATRIALSQQSRRPDGRFQCQGAFAREFGFSEEQLKEEGDIFFFTTLYRVDRDSGDLILDRLVGQSPYGQFQIVRD